MDALRIGIKAADFAAQKHINQRRKSAGEEPYINHPIAVANVISDYFGNDQVNHRWLLDSVMLNG